MNCRSRNLVWHFFVLMLTAITALVAQADLPEKADSLTVRSSRGDVGKRFRSRPLLSHRRSVVRSVDLVSDDAPDTDDTPTPSRTRMRMAAHRQANALNLELGGKGLVYSLAYERSFSNYVSAGVGFSYVGISADAGDLADAQVAIYFVPVYVNLYYNFPTDTRHRFFGTGGVTIANLSISARSDAVTEVSNKLGSEIELDLGVGAGGTFPFPVAGLGYEFLSRSNFLVRLSAYGIYTYDIFPQAFNLWAGIATGVTF